MDDYQEHMETVLIIEDNDLLRENIGEILEMEGYTVLSAENGERGVACALKHLPDLIISDVNMPLLNGFEVLERLRKEEASKTIPFIFLTVKNSMHELRTGMNLGADDYLTKPFDMDQLLQATRTRLDKKSEVVSKETARYNKLKNAVGLPITSVIDDPLRNIERLANLVNGQLGELSDQEVGEITRLIASDASKLRKDINKMLFFYRIEALKSNPESVKELKAMEALEADRLILSAASAITAEFNRKGDLYTHLEPSSVQFPQEFLEFIINELLGNACRYSTRGSSLKLTGQKQMGTYKITIQDQGIGFVKGKSLEDIAPYIRLDQDQSRNSGLGLGLYNVKTLVSLFDGSISLSSEAGVGTAISVILKVVDSNE